MDQTQTLVYMYDESAVGRYGHSNARAELFSIFSLVVIPAGQAVSLAHSEQLPHSSPNNGFQIPFFQRVVVRFGITSDITDK